MKFINQGEPQQVRIQEGPNRYRWNLLKNGETIDLPQDVGVRYGFLKVTDVTSESNQELPKATEGKIGETKVETKQFDLPDLFLKELTKIKGIGFKTAKDIVVWGTKEKLIEAISMKAELPFRDDIVKKLRKKYGK